MEDMELIYSVVNNSSYPFIIVEERENGKFEKLFSNKSMNKLLSLNEENLSTQNEPAEKEKNKDEELTVQTEGESKADVIEEDAHSKGFMNQEMQDLFARYKEEKYSDKHTSLEMEIFNGMYEIHFNQSKGKIVAIFMKIDSFELFNLMSFHDLSNSCSAIVIILDDKGQIIDINDCFLKFVGMEKADVLHKNFFQTFIPGDINILNNYMSDILLQDEYHHQFVTPMKDANENLYKINWQVSKVIKANQSYIIAIGSDVSRFVKENGELKRELQSINLGFEYFPFGVAYMDSKGYVSKTNKRFKKMFKVAEKKKSFQFEEIGLFKKHIGLAKLQENLKFVKDVSYTVKDVVNKQPIRLRVNVRVLKGKKESSAFYILVVQNIK